MQTRKLHRLFNIDTSLIVAIRKGRSGYSRIAYKQLSSVARVGSCGRHLWLARSARARTASQVNGNWVRLTRYVQFTGYKAHTPNDTPSISSLPLETPPLRSPKYSPWSLRRCRSQPRSTRSTPTPPSPTRGSAGIRSLMRSRRNTARPHKRSPGRPAASTSSVRSVPSARSLSACRLDSSHELTLARRRRRAH